MKKQICTFNLDDMRLGVVVGHIQEILRRQEITSVPLAPANVAGLLNLRGQIVMVVDLKKKFGLSEAEVPNPAFIILRGEEGPVCFRVDKVGEVIEVEEDTREALPLQLEESIRNCAAGVYALDSGLVLEMTPERLYEN